MTEMMLTHRQYFQTYKLSVAQYGEILVAQAVAGEKRGDTQPCYDVLADAAQLGDLLSRAGVDRTSPVWPAPETEVRIQVRSKLRNTPSGTATVVHCKETDLQGMTHLAVILVSPADGTIAHAWLMTSEAAARLRKKDEGRIQYIRVSQLKSEPLPDGVVDITPPLAAAADRPLDLVFTAPAAPGAREVIRKTPGVCGGNARIRDTRIPVWTLWRLKELGRTDTQLLDDYPSLTAGDLEAAWAYAMAHPEEVAAAIKRQGLALSKHPVKA